jgi:hypothetical protein
MIIDFIVKLLLFINPVTKVIYDSIIIIVDKLTKYTIIILFKETYNILEIG